MSYYDTPSLPSTHLGPADINPAYSSFDGFDDGSYTTSQQVASALSLPNFVGVMYVARKNGSGWLASILYGLVANSVMYGVASSPLGMLHLAVPAATGYFAYKAGKGY